MVLTCSDSDNFKTALKFQEEALEYAREIDAKERTFETIDLIVKIKGIRHFLELAEDEEWTASGRLVSGRS